VAPASSTRPSPDPPQPLAARASNWRIRSSRNAHGSSSSSWPRLIAQAASETGLSARARRIGFLTGTHADTPRAAVPVPTLLSGLHRPARMMRCASGFWRRCRHAGAQCDCGAELEIGSDAADGIPLGRQRCGPGTGLSWSALRVATDRPMGLETSVLDVILVACRDGGLHPTASAQASR